MCCKKEATVPKSLPLQFVIKYHGRGPRKKKKRKDKPERKQNSVKKKKKTNAPEISNIR